jgi:hypothetical protein
MAQEHQEVGGEQWVSFPGGELEGRRPKVLCPSCRDALAQRAATRSEALSSRSALLCFACYRANLDRDRLLRAAGDLDTASEERFQTQLPFEPVDKPRLEKLKVDRATARAAVVLGAERFSDRRRQAQIAARHVLQSIGGGLKARELAARAAELQLPEAWLPFVMSR